MIEKEDERARVHTEKTKRRKLTREEGGEGWCKKIGINQEDKAEGGRLRV